MPFISPMLASPLKRDPDFTKPNTWAAEEKFDGHRVVAEVRRLASGTVIQAWSRHGKTYLLPRHIQAELARLPEGTYDGEFYVPGKRCYGAATLSMGQDARYVIFDLLELFSTRETGSTQSIATNMYSYDERRKALTELFQKIWPNEQTSDEKRPVFLSRSVNIDSLNKAMELLKTLWKRDGEGLILKRRDSRYAVGKRPAHIWIKFKKLQSDVLTVIGFLPSTGEIENRGLYGRTVLASDDGRAEFSIKTLNMQELAKLEQAALTAEPGAPHPFVGRRLRIEFQERTTDGQYREPRWDRWEDE